MVETMTFKSTGVREINLILAAVSERATDDEIQAAADNAARIWKILWARDTTRP